MQGIRGMGSHSLGATGLVLWPGRWDPNFQDSCGGIQTSDTVYQPAGAFFRAGIEQLAQWVLCLALRCHSPRVNGIKRLSHVAVPALIHPASGDPAQVHLLLLPTWEFLAHIASYHPLRSEAHDREAPK